MFSIVFFLSCFPDGQVCGVLAWIIPQKFYFSTYLLHLPLGIALVVWIQVGNGVVGSGRGGKSYLVFSHRSRGAIIVAPSIRHDPE